MTLDVMSNSPSFTSKHKAIFKENPIVNQKSLRAFFPRTPSTENSAQSLLIIII